MERVTGATNLTGALSGTSASFNSNQALTIVGTNSTSANNTITGYSADLYAVAVRQRGASAGISGANFMAQIISATGAEGLEIYTPNSKELILGTNSTARLTIGTTGAATFAAANSGVITLTTNGSANNWTSAITGNSTTSQSYGLLIQAGTNSTDGALRVRNQANSLDWLFVRGDGNVAIGTTLTGFNAAGLPLVVGSGSGNTGMTIFSGAASSGSIHFADAETTGSASFSGFINYDHAANSMQFGTSNTNQMRITSDGYLRLVTKGIQFNGDTSDSNSLDDYEEGSFTPVVVGSSTAGTATYAAQNGRYVKIGRAVSFNLYCDWSAGTGTGDLYIGGLPYVADAAAIFPACAIGETSGISLAATGIMTARVQISTTLIFLSQYALGGGSASAVSYDGSGYVVLSGTYYV